MEVFKMFETQRLILKPTHSDDAEFILELYNSPKWIKYIGDRNVKTLEAANEYIQHKIYPQFVKNGFSNYTIIRKGDNIKLGICGLFERQGLKDIDIGFALLSRFENMGYAFEAANRLLKAGFDDFNLTRIYAITTKDNFPSQKLLLKLGLEFNKTFTLPNDTEELLQYKINSIG